MASLTVCRCDVCGKEAPETEARARWRHVYFAASRVLPLTSDAPRVTEGDACSAKCAATLGERVFLVDVAGT